LIVSGFVTSPCDHWRIFSGEAREMRIASKSGASCVFSCWNLNTFFISVSRKPKAKITVAVINRRARGDRQRRRAPAYLFIPPGLP
jgi:hypothetical protein